MVVAAQGNENMELVKRRNIEHDQPRFPARNRQTEREVTNACAVVPVESHRV